MSFIRATMHFILYTEEKIDAYTGKQMLDRSREWCLVQEHKNVHVVYRLFT